MPFVILPQFRYKVFQHADRVRFLIPVCCNSLYLGQCTVKLPLVCPDNLRQYAAHAYQFCTALRFGEMAPVSLLLLLWQLQHIEEFCNDSVCSPLQWTCRQDGSFAFRHCCRQVLHSYMPCLPVSHPPVLFEYDVRSTSADLP